MRLAGDLGLLTYCTNIHPGESWAETRRNIEERVSAVKAQLSPDEPFGVGLRLSARASEELAEEGNLSEFAELLQRLGLFVFTINGFPYGPFHGTPVKIQVYEPDWRTQERLEYTNRLADQLAFLLPDSVRGTISTVPGAFRPNGEGQEAAMTDNFIRHAAYLHGLAARTGKIITLALEPEPYCFVETTEEAAAIFRDWLFGAEAIENMAMLTGLPFEAAEAALRRHLGVCYDVCHAAVEYEDPAETIGLLRQHGIQVAKLQLSAALHLREVTPEKLERLRAFDERTYLHQVVARRGETLDRFLDLPEAFEAAETTAYDEWRVHFHVPLFLTELEHFSTTQHVLAEILRLHKDDPISQHLEIETYTWDVLPPELRSVPIDDAVAREARWVLDQLTS
jgi:sugar phosphate isomerase/epimerase